MRSLTSEISLSKTSLPQSWASCLPPAAAHSPSRVCCRIWLRAKLVVIDDTNEGNVAINGDGSYRKVFTYTVWILMRYKEFDMNDRQEKLNTCRKIFRQFLSKIVIDKYDWQFKEYTYMLSDQIDSREIGAYFINGLTGVEFHLDVSEPLNLEFNYEEWNE